MGVQLSAKRRQTLLRSLAARESGVQKPHVKLQDVPRRCVSVRALVDAEGLLLRCIILGFTRDGNYVLSYSLTACTAASGGLHLQVWRFKTGEPLALLYDVPLFRSGSTDEEGSSSAAYAGDAWEEGSNVQLVVCEAPGSGMLVVHGRATVSGVGGGDGEDVAGQRVTLIPPPSQRCSSLQATHLHYPADSTHQPAFSPLLQLLPPHALLLIAGGHMQLLHLQPWCHSAAYEAATQPLAISLWQQPMSANVVRQHSSVSGCGICMQASAATAHTADGSAEAEQREGAGVSGSIEEEAGGHLEAWECAVSDVRCLQATHCDADSRGGVAVLHQPSWSFDTEALLRASLPPALLHCYCVVDYDATLLHTPQQPHAVRRAVADMLEGSIAAHSWGPRQQQQEDEAAGTILVLILALLAPRGEHPGDTGGMQRVVMLVAAINALTGAAALRSMAELKLGPASGAATGGGWEGESMRRAAQFHALLLRRRHWVPRAASALPLHLSNASVLGSGKSLDRICSSTMPFCILDFEAQSSVV